MRALQFSVAFWLVGVCTAAESDSWTEALLFHASFDDSPRADVARGDSTLFTAASLKREQVQTGLHSDAVALDRGGGRYGGALRFAKKTAQVVFYRGGDNLPYRRDDFGGAVSFWMRVQPDEDLPTGYVDPLQITDKQWNDASFFVDFTDKNPRQFRLGVFSDREFWNPADRAWEEIPTGERPMVTVAEPKFTRDAWTHVVFVWRDFNSQARRGEAALYLDGVRQGRVSGPQRFSWDPARVVIMLGINYVGWIDDLAIFSQPLTESEIERLRDLADGVNSLKRR